MKLGITHLLSYAPPPVPCLCILFQIFHLVMCYLDIYIYIYIYIYICSSRIVRIQKLNPSNTQIIHNHKRERFRDMSSVSQQYPLPSLFFPISLKSDSSPLESSVPKPISLISSIFFFQRLSCQVNDIR